ncbi:hypothetical protein [Bradyrhizobium sp. CW4]|uniref:hypothetical protein n=1 Tax=Bradyrhizobium sp. CW4 TaxID=2782687 RepID=UPI001FFAD6D9|nr:hypothetical protein [Bradyrhizobium sp. CW4]
MRRLLVALCLLAATLWSAPAFAQARNQLGPLCTTDTTPAEQMIDACSKIIALKVFKGEQLATVLARGGLEQEGRIPKGRHRRHGSDPAPAEPSGLQPARLSVLRQRRLRDRGR